MPALNGLPGEPEVWKDSQTGKAYLVYFVPGSDPPIPLLYNATTAELQAAFGPGKTIKFDQTFADTAALTATGPIEWGERSEIANDTGDPFEAWVNAINDQAAVRPWLRDSEVLGLIAESLIEGRDMTLAELQQTTWWKEHNEQQRQWLLLYESDPATAKQKIEDQRILVGDLLRQSGMSNPSNQLINAISQNYITGDWSQTYTMNQIKAITDPYSGVRVDSILAPFMKGRDSTSEGERQVADMVNEWLGPKFGNWDQDRIAKWAGKLRNNPDAEDELIGVLQKQRLAMFPEYTDPNTTYDMIAQPWRGVWQDVLGEVADETKGLFAQIVKGNDVEAAEKRLRQYGINTGNKTVVRNFAEGLLGTAVGQQVVNIQ